MTGKQIKILLMERDITQRQIAKALKVTPCAVHGTVFDIKNMRSKRIRRYIANLLCMDINILWPSNNGKEVFLGKTS